MHVLHTILRWGLGLIAGLVLLILCFIAERLGWIPRSLAPQSGEIALTGITSEVKIVRDSHDVPHISAGNAHDVYFGLGFAHAQDRLWQMAFSRQLLQGRLAELIGAPGIPIDTYFRALDLRGRARDSLDHLSLETRDGLEAYADGVNAWATAHRAQLPPEFSLLMTGFEPWRPEDSMLILKYLELDLSYNVSEEILRARATKLIGTTASDLFPRYPDNDPVTLRDASIAQHASAVLSDPFWQAFAGLQGASNNWVVDGRYTKSGKPLLANDPHLGLSAPGIWYLVHLALPTGDVAGATTPGIPTVLLGHNSHFAWGFTTTGGDTEDLIAETVNPDDKTRYLTPRGSAPFDIKQAKIKVRFAPSKRISLMDTRHGPVLPETTATRDAARPGTVLALSATCLSRTDTTMDAAFKLMSAKNIGAFHGALSNFQAPEQNMVYADTGGNIGFIVPGLVPLRGPLASQDGLTPADGKIQEQLWTGFIPYAELPQLYNPLAGRIWTANNKIVPNDYPHFIGATWYSWYRARRIGGLLSKGAPYDVQSFAAMQMDNYAPDAADILPLLLKTAENGTREQRAIKLLQNWNFLNDANSPAPLIFYAWASHLQKLLINDELGKLAANFRSLSDGFIVRVLTDENGMSRWCDDTNTMPAETCDDMVKRALTSALDDLQKAYGSDMTRWRWGAAHAARFDHQALGGVPLINGFFNRTIEASGGPNSIDRADMSYAGDHPYADVFGASLRAIYDLSDLSKSRFMIPMGQSGNPLSPHYDDFNAAWAKGGTFEIPLTESLYTQGSTGTWTLKPSP